MKIEDIQVHDVLVSTDASGTTYYHVLRVARVRVLVQTENGNTTWAYPIIFDRKAPYAKHFDIVRLVHWVRDIDTDCRSIVAIQEIGPCLLHDNTFRHRDMCALQLLSNQWEEGSYFRLELCRAIPHDDAKLVEKRPAGDRYVFVPADAVEEVPNVR